MTTLDEIWARAEAATEGPWHAEVIRDYAPAQETYIIPDITRDRYGNNAINVGEDKATAEFIAHARTDVPKLVAALKAVLENSRNRAAAYRETADRLNAQVTERHPDRGADAANRYECYALETESSAIRIEATIRKALDGVD